MASYVARSASATSSRVASEKTTPKPNVSSGLFRSYTVIRAAGSIFLMRVAA